ncbi:hypothetical protein [Chitinophaga sp. S165]|uniref:hypothetical protein n=1 Tax=Chitinophaga sp. S165 TaxID=2135462 RepID=UPI000D717F20|nr:hypothetical protein [Chitinophaga sp. S165]
MHCKALQISGGKFKDLSITSYGTSELFSINNLIIIFHDIAGNISISKLKITRTKLLGTIQKDTDFSLKNIEFTHFGMDNLFNNGKARFFDFLPITNEQEISSIFITNSNLAKADFFGIPMNKVGRLQIRNSYLIDCTFVNIIWKDNFDLVMDGADPAVLLDRKEMFRQLKYSYSKQGDSFLEHRFHSLEMNIYRRYLKKKRSTFSDKNRYGKWRWERQTSIILWFSSWSSNYGQSFKAPLLILLIAGSILFPIMLISGFLKDFQSGLHFNFSWQSISTTIGHFCNFLNPLRRYDTMDINAGLLIDFLMRIIASYCIYNFIRATRRFVK